jgi:endonuclease/exonuclease/phosphatase family metal-dependent hydrolase
LVAVATLHLLVLGQSPAVESAFQRSPGHIRIITWNVGDRSIFPKDPSRPDTTSDERPGRVGRVLRAVNADLVCLQEVSRPPAAVAALMQGLQPLEPGRRWSGHRVLDNVIASAFPILQSGGGTVRRGVLRRGHATVTVDLPAPFARDLTVICAHFQSKAGRAESSLRQRQADMLAAWIRDQREETRRRIPPGTPLVLLGDLNVIDMPSPSLRTLLTGDIVNEREFGSDMKPDWDGSDLLDVLPRHYGSASEMYTWRDDTQRFPPGVLDRVLLTDSVALVSLAFIVNTMIMTVDELRQTGLRANDVMLDPTKGIHDHLPLVVDVALRP